MFLRKERKMSILFSILFFIMNGYCVLSPLPFPLTKEASIQMNDLNPLLVSLTQDSKNRNDIEWKKNNIRNRFKELDINNDSELDLILSFLASLISINSPESISFENELRLMVLGMNPQDIKGKEEILTFFKVLNRLNATPGCENKYIPIIQQRKVFFVDTYFPYLNKMSIFTKKVQNLQLVSYRNYLFRIKFLTKIYP